METLLSRQLQQACLETQVRTSELSSSPPSHDPSTFPSPLPTSSPSSSASSDPGPGTSPASAPPVPPNGPDDEEPLHDPVLQVISDMLMDGDLDDRKCMYAECVSFMKELYDMIGPNEAPVCADTDSAGLLRSNSYSPVGEAESSVVTGEEDSYSYSDSGFLGFSTAYGDVNLDVVADGLMHSGVPAPNDQHSDADIHAQRIEPSNYATMSGHRLSAASHEDGNVLDPNTDDNDWIDDLFNSMDAITCPQDASGGGAVLSPAVSVTSYNGPPRADSSLQRRNGSTAGYDNEDPLPELDSLSPSSAVTEITPSFEGRHDNVRFDSDGGQVHNFTAGSNERTAIQSLGRAFERSCSDTSQSLPRGNPSVGSNSRLKRSATELDSAAVSGSVDRVLSPAESVAAPDDSREESVSYVRNEHLNAEEYASILNGGLSSVRGTCSRKPPYTSARDSVGKPSNIVSTVADLEGLLVSCAGAVASNNLRRAQEILKEIRQDASPYGSGLQRLAHYFAEGLVARISGTGNRLYSVFRSNGPSAAKMLRAHQLAVEVCSFVKVSHYFANRAILEAAEGSSRLHIVDYGILYGLQWPCLISALAERKGGPPVLRITGIDFPQPGYAPAERIEMTGLRLAEYAKTYGVPFEYRAIASRWEIIQPSSLSLRQDEVIIVNSIYRMHNLLDESVLASNPRKTVLSKIHEINPKLFVHGVKNGNYNAPFFMPRFKEALASFSGLFDMFETLIKPDNQERMMIERELLGRDILNVVACEGQDRIERPETYRQWQNRQQKAGFVQIPPDSKVLSESKTFVKCKYNKNFSVDTDGSWMLLSWKGKVVNGLSLWKPAGRK